MILKNLSKNYVIVNKIEKATPIWKRFSGLIPYPKMPDDFGLWIPGCNSIHSFCMKFEFDAVFVDANMRVKKCISSIKPNRIIFPVWGARSVFELPTGSILNLKIEIGDQLHVIT